MTCRVEQLYIERCLAANYFFNSSERWALVQVWSSQAPESESGMTTTACPETVLEDE